MKYSALTLAGLVCAHAAYGAAPSQATLERVKVASDEVAQERKRSRATWSREQAELDARVASLEKRLAELRVQEETLAQGVLEVQGLVDAATEAVRKLDDRIDHEERKTDRLHGLVREQFLGLRSRLALAPPHGTRRSRAEKLDEIQRSLSDRTEVTIHLATVLRALASEAHVLGSEELFEMDIPDEAGVIRRCEVLRCGTSAAYFRCLDGSCYGVLIRGSEDSMAHGWYRDLGWSARAAIDEAISYKKELGRCGVIRLPVDVTQRMTARAAPTDSGLLRTMSRGGPVMLPLLLVAFAGLGLVVQRWWTYRLEARGAAVSERTIELATRGQWDEALSEARKDETVFGTMCAAGLGRRGASLDEVSEAMEQAVLREQPALERYLREIGVLAAVSPLLGLLGTVTGMISTFDVITLHGTGDPRLLAGGISEALITTETGLIIAIPLLLAHRYLNGRLQTLLAQCQDTAVELSSHITGERGRGS